jgi:purine operon repressor
MKRSERLVDMTHFLLENPFQLINLNQFAQRYQSSKSSISEDIEIIRQIFKQQNVGSLVTYTGVAGGATFIPDVSLEKSQAMATELKEQLESENRLLPGGYLYLSDILGNPRHLKQIGAILGHEFQTSQVDAVMTIATKGIPIAQATAENLSIPFVIARRDPKITEGATLSVNYMSGSSSKIESMVLSKRALSKGQRVLIVDDFMKGGGTINGMKSLVQEMDCRVAGVAVFIEGPYPGERPITDFKSILRVDKIDLMSKSIVTRLGSIYDENEKEMTIE